MIRVIAVSVMPPMKPASAPSSRPITSEIAVAENPIRSETRDWDDSRQHESAVVGALTANAADAHQSGYQAVGNAAETPHPRSAACREWRQHEFARERLPGPTFRLDDRQHGRQRLAAGQRLGRHRYVVERSSAWLVGYRRP